MSEQEQGGAVQSANEAFYDFVRHASEVDLNRSFWDRIRERDAAIRRAAIDECAALCDALEKKVRPQRAEIGAAYGHVGQRIRELAK